MGNLGKSKLNIEKIKELYTEGLNDKEISKILNYPHTSVSYVRRKILKLPIVLETISLTQEQEEILIGTLLGDSYIGYTHSKCNYPNITFAHCKKQSIYAYTKFNKLRIIMSSIKERCYKNSTYIKGVFCNIQPIVYSIGKNCKCLIKYREIFYNNNGVKIIPIEFLKEKFTAQSLAYLYMDDGCKNHNTYNLNLQGFSNEDLILFIELLKNKFNLEFNLRKDKTLYLRYNSISIFENLIKSYITEDMQYKIH